LPWGVGIGIDYALYILSVTLVQLREGKSLSEAYYRALLFTGIVVMLTGVTLAFMFLWNMLGALILLPALAHFLLKPEPLTAASEEASPADALQSEPASEPLRSSQVTPA
jgi:hypothetical protein